MAQNYISWLASNLIPSLVVFAIIFLTAVAEMPIMAFALRKLAQGAATSRKIVAGAFMVYVMFAAVYAALYILITGDQYYYLGTGLAALGLVRFASGMLVH